MSIRNSVTIALIVLLSAFAAYADGINNNFQDGVNGQFGNGSWLPNNAPAVAPPPPPFSTPVITLNTCNIAPPYVTGNQIALALGGFCTYTATCNGLSCTGGNSIISWAISSQNCGGHTCFDIDNLGDLLGGVDADFLGAPGTFSIIITATNANGTSAPVVQTINVPPVPSAPAILATTCNVTTPVTTGSPVALSGGGNCIFTATCAGIACTGGNVITSWAITAQSNAAAFAIDNSGDLLGGAAAATVVVNNTYTVTVTATNAVGTSPSQTQTINTPIVSVCAGVLDLSLGCMIPGIGP